MAPTIYLAFVALALTGASARLFGSVEVGDDDFWPPLQVKNDVENGWAKKLKIPIYLGTMALLVSIAFLPVHHGNTRSHRTQTESRG